MVLTKDAYESEKRLFLEQYSDEIKKMLNEQKEKYLEEALKEITWKAFAGKYMKGAWLVLIVAFFACVKEIISLQALVGIILLELFIFAFAYAEWTDEAKARSLCAWPDKAQLLIRDYVWQKMQNTAVTDEEEFQKVIQFYAVALYDIPRCAWFIDAY